MGGSEPKVDTFGQELLLSAVEQNCDSTLDELKEMLALEADIHVGKSSVDRALGRLQLTRKKQTYRLMGPDKERIAPLRAQYEETVADIDVKKLAFLDECGASLKMDLAYGRSHAGERAYGPRPTERGKKRSRSLAR